MSQPLAFDVFWSMRSSYCYLSLDRIMDIRRRWNVDANLRIVYPIAVRNPAFFTSVSKHHRPYHTRDSQRVADFQGIPYRRPVPDPILQNMETREFASEQPHIRRLTRLAASAQEQGKALEFQDQVMRLLWDGRTDNWNEGTHLADAITRAGLDADALMQAVDTAPEHFDALIEQNQDAQEGAGHSGVPLFTFNGEPFFGQDRIDMLVWRMKQNGLTPR